MLASPSRVLRFDKFTVDLARYAVLRGDEQLALRRQSFDVLRYLAEHRGEVVSRDELVRAVWAVAPARPEDSVFQCVKDIRRALGDDARWIIRAVPGRGYQFMAEVAAAEAPPALPTSAMEPNPPAEAETASQARASVGAPRAEGRSSSDAEPLEWTRALIAASLLIIVLVAGGWLIWQQLRPKPPVALKMMAVPTLAVLPFTPPDPETDVGREGRALSDQVATEIQRQNIGSMLGLRSAAGARGATTDLKAMGRRLDARYLLVGSLHREGNGYAVNAQLIEAETGRQLWSRSLQYAPAERDHVAVAVGGTLGVVITTLESQRPLPDRLEAAHYAIRAFTTQNNHRTPAAHTEALALYEKALDLDRDWVPALLGYAWAQVFLSGGEPAALRSARLDQAQDAVEHAIKLAPFNAGGYHRRAQVLRARGDPAGAMAASQHALVLNQNLALAHGELGRSKIDLGRAPEAIAHIEQAIRLSRAHSTLFLWYMWAGEAAVHVGDYDAAVHWLEKGKYANVPHWELKPWLAIAYAGLGREAEGRELIAEHLSEGRKLSIVGWRKHHHPRGSGVLAEQRERIEGLLRRLGVSESKVATSSAKQ